MGMDLGAQLKSVSVDIDSAVFARGLSDALSGAKTVLTEEEAKAAIAELQKGLAVKQAEAAKAVGQKNLAEGTPSSPRTRRSQALITMPSGLQYRILTSGAGKKPTATDTVVCHYRGTRIDGKEIDSSYKRGEPATFPVSQVIRGWAVALQMMPVGSKWQLFIPPALAYGESGMGPDIGPNATLIFEIELVAIK